MKKLALAIMLGLGVMMSGCGNNTIKCEYTQIHTLMSGSSASPCLNKGDKFNFNNPKFDNKIQDINENGEKVVKVLKNNGDKITIYEINVSTLKDGWGTVENENNVYVADAVKIEKIPAYQLAEIGLYNGNNLAEMVTATHVKAHGVHTHGKECK